MKEEKVGLEVAQAEFERFCDEMALDFNVDTMREEDRLAFSKNRDRLVRAIQYGHLVIGDDGEPTYTPWRNKSTYKDPITFHERTGATLLATDLKKKGNDAAKTYAMLGDLTKLPASTFTKLAGEDIKVCEALMQLLMD